MDEVDTQNPRKNVRLVQQCTCESKKTRWKEREKYDPRLALEFNVIMYWIFSSKEKKKQRERRKKIEGERKGVTGSTHICVHINVSMNIVMNMKTSIV